MNINVRRWKMCIAFWIFGICNNYSYVVMLSAANDILKRLEGNKSVATNKSQLTEKIDLDCTKLGTGAILIADIVPTFIFKLVAPLFIQRIRFPYKVSFVVVAAVVSFIIVGLSKSISSTIFGVVLASLSSGVGEVTFLALTAFYEGDSILFWSSGTGGAGVFGALSYAGLTTIISPNNTLFAVSVFPLFIIIAYVFLLEKPDNDSFNWCFPYKYDRVHDDDDKFHVTDTSRTPLISDQEIPTIREKLLLIKSFLFLTIPLALVYLFEYIINQGLFELLYFPKIFLAHQVQYRWYQVTYQIGVFISRSSLSIVKIKRTWIFAILQAGNVVLFILQITYRFIPSIWVIFILILYEGLLGGGAYVNTFHLVLKYSNPAFKEFNMGAASFWDSFGISMAGMLSIPIHNALCDNFSL